MPCDPTTGLDYARMRFYDPTTGRFLTPDPLGGGHAYTPAGEGQTRFVRPCEFENPRGSSLVCREAL